MKKIFVIIVAAMLFVAAAPNEKNVLIIGDSISIGYTPFVIKGLENEANVVRIKGNAGDTKNGLSKIKEWLGTTKWDVIHFNFGLHDLCYRSPESTYGGNRDKVCGEQSVPIKEYKKNLQMLVDMLEATGAELIFATTTFIPDEEIGRFVGDEIKYNKAALKVMKRNGVTVNPLYDISEDTHNKYGRGLGDVHYKPEGSKVFAEKVISEIRKKL